MSVDIRPYRKSNRGGWEIDVRVRLLNGEIFRRRFRASSTSKALAQREGEKLEAEIIRNGVPAPKEEGAKEPAPIPTLGEFAEPFLANYSKANRLKHSTIVTQRCIIETHLKPMFGNKKLDEIGSKDVQALRGKLAEHSAKTTNNVVGVLGKILRVAFDWGVIEKLPFRVKPLKTMDSEMKFYEDSEYERLIAASKKLGTFTTLVALLGGEAGLRVGEMLALRWSDIDFDRRLMTISRSEWCGVEDSPKSNRSRRVPLTSRLVSALKAHRHLLGERVLVVDVSGPNMKSLKLIRSRMRAAQRLANLDATGNVHILRHTFCSRLAMRGRSALEIQKLAGHASLTTTMRYLHLSPSALSTAVVSLETPVELGGATVEQVGKSEGAPEGTPVAASS